MRRTPRGPHAVRAVLAALALLVAGSAAVLVPAAPALAAAPGAGDVRIRVDDVTPTTPVRTSKAARLTFRLTLTNTSGETLRNVRIQAYRGNPIGNQAALDASLADRTPPTDGIEFGGSKPVRVTLGSTSVTTTFATSTSVQSNGPGLCLCDNQVYPVHLVARTTDGTVVGATTTYVPSRLYKTAPTQVSWLWPLIDRPHRLDEEDLFTDDDLAESVTSGGRLDKALQTVEDLDESVPITLLVDPELLDELEVMATGRYRVQTDSGTTAGTGKDVAKGWLDRFGALLTDDSAVQVSLTPYADPDTTSLAAQGATWATVLPAAMNRRVNAALNGRAAATDVAWPAGGVTTPTALNALAASGVTTVVLDSTSVTPSTEDGIPVDVTRLNTGTGPVTGAMTSPAVRDLVAEAVAEDDATTAAAALPRLNAELAVRAIQTGSDTAHVVLAPPRYVDPSPLRAARAIEDTSTSAFTTPTAVRDLVDDRPSAVSRLRALATDAPHLPRRLIRAAEDAATRQPDVSALLRRSSTEARALAGGIPRGIQRISSSAWRIDPDNPFGTRGGFVLAEQLTDQIDKIMTGVRIVSPASSSYTLGSDNSALPVTVENTLPYAVVIQVDVRAQDGLPGFTAREARATRIGPNSKLTVQIPSSLARSGRIPIQAQLETATGTDLGEPVDLFVRSTVFGVIGVVITVVAGSVLALALLVRFARRLRRLRRKAAKAQAPTAAATATPTSATTAAPTAAPTEAPAGERAP